MGEGRPAYDEGFVVRTARRGVRRGGRPETTGRFTMRTRVLIAALGVGAALALAGCGSSNGGNSAGGGGSTSGAQTVQTQTVGSMSDVLTNSAGKPLYVTDQESGGTVMCSTSACTAIWVPLTVPNGTQPTASSAVSSHLGTVMRPDGTTQVTWDGKPLYTFSFDHAAGQVTGDGKQDSFGGTNFTWHVATASGVSSGTPSGTPSSSSNYGGSGY
jgi:predicted lipoprotein with Yx(FWY)xxD motif